MRIKSSIRGTLIAAVVMTGGCAGDATVFPPQDDQLAVGTWGGENAGVIVVDTVAHVHIGCTFGDFAGPVTLDPDGRFSVAGSYVLRAYPIQVGPSHPAQFTGVVLGNKLSLTVAVNDTVEKKQTMLGPVTLTFAREPHMGPCPICRKPPQ